MLFLLSVIDVAKQRLLLLLLPDEKIIQLTDSNMAQKDTAMVKNSC
jgi:hypothetical protein